MSEKLCLQWNDFQENVKVAFGNFREDKNFTDVTLVCEDGQPLEAHRVILAAWSPFFKGLLERNKHPHPLIYIRRSKFEDLLAIVDFLYCGEANVFQENLDSFLSIAEELQLKGLMGKTDGGVENTIPDVNFEPKFPKPLDRNFAKTPQTVKQRFQPMIEEEKKNKVALLSSSTGNLEELEEKVRSLMEKSENMLANGKQKADKCKVCGKEGLGAVIKDHIEANHLEGIVLPCKDCEKTFRCRNTLSVHVRKHHKN